jgi:hypothetical protein
LVLRGPLVIFEREIAIFIREMLYLHTPILSCEELILSMLPMLDSLDHINPVMTQRSKGIET